MVQREGERGRRKRGGARAPRRTGFFFPPRWALPFSVRAFPSVLTPPPDEESILLYGGGGGPVAARFWWPSLLPAGRPPAARPPPQRSAPQLCWGLVVAVLSLPGERGRLPVVDFGVPCGLLVRLLDRR